jgi:hypothetical protein
MGNFQFWIEVHMGIQREVQTKTGKKGKTNAVV